MCLMRKLAKNRPGQLATLVPVLWLDSALNAPEAVQVSVLKGSYGSTKLQRVRHFLRPDAPTPPPQGRAGGARYFEPHSSMGRLGSGRYAVRDDAAWRAHQRLSLDGRLPTARKWCFSQASPLPTTNLRGASEQARVASLNKSAVQAAASPRCGRAIKSPRKCHLTVMFKYPLSSNLL
jgi:hypothetical protein